MLSLLLWIIVGIGILCIVVFPGKRKGALPDDRETVISDAACNISAISFILTQMLFPLFGYFYLTTGYPYRDQDTFIEDLTRVITEININYLRVFEQKPGNSVYGFLMLTAVFCFFAGMSIYKNGIKTGNKLFLLLPLISVTAGVGLFFLKDEFARRHFDYSFRYQVILQFDIFIRYLCGACIMIAALYGIYLLLKKITKNELIPLIVILILSFFAPGLDVIRDGLYATREGVFSRMIFGPDIPLFPMGMIVMKYKDKILPKTNKGIFIHLASWTIVGGISFYALHGLQFLLIKLAGLYPSDATTDVWYEGLGKKLATLDKIYRVDSIPWLILGLALSMVILCISLLIGTGNRVTKFFREHCYLITVFLFSRHVFFEAGRWDNDFWLITLGMPEKMFLIVPFIYFALSVVLAFLIKRFILEKLPHF